MSHPTKTETLPSTELLLVEAVAVATELAEQRDRLMEENKNLRAENDQLRQENFFATLAQRITSAQS